MSMSLRDYLWKNRWRFTQAEFARRVDISPTYLSKVANGNVIPKMHVAKKIELETNREVLWDEIMQFCYSVQEAKNERLK